MIEVLQFVFSSFWVWLGSAILLGIATQGAYQMLALMLSAFAARRS